jgi:hypothetical protein
VRVSVGAGRAGVERVGEDAVHDGVGPEPLAVAGPPRAGGQPLDDPAGGHPLVDQPAVEHPHHRGLVLVDLRVPRDAVPPGDVAVAVGAPAADPLPGPGPLQLAAAEPLGQDGPLVLGDRPLELEQELVVRVVGDRPLDELDVAGDLAGLLQREDPAGMAPGESVGAVDADDVEFARAGGVAEAVEGGAVERRARIALVDVDVIAFGFVAVCGRPAPQGAELAVDRLVAPLPLGRDAGVDRGSHGLHSDLAMNCSNEGMVATRAGSRRPARVAWARHDGGRKWNG